MLIKDLQKICIHYLHCFNCWCFVRPPEAQRCLAQMKHDNYLHVLYHVFWCKAAKLSHLSCATLPTLCHYATLGKSTEALKSICQRLLLTQRRDTLKGSWDCSLVWLNLGSRLRCLPGHAWHCHSKHFSHACSIILLNSHFWEWFVEWGAPDKEDTDGTGGNIVCRDCWAPLWSVTRSFQAPSYFVAFYHVLFLPQTFPALSLFSSLTPLCFFGQLPPFSSPWLHVRQHPSKICPFDIIYSSSISPNTSASKSEGRNLVIYIFESFSLHT